MSPRRGMKVDERLVPMRNSAVYAVEIDGEAVLLDEATGRLHLLNPSAALVWACFDGTSTIGDIVTDISDELRVPYDRVLADTLAVIRELASEGLLVNGKGAHTRAAPVDATNEPVSDPRFIAEPPNT
jgi:coenzyme PQQ synthesis protein D (PqqD)